MPTCALLYVLEINEQPRADESRVQISSFFAASPVTMQDWSWDRDWTQQTHLSNAHSTAMVVFTTRTWEKLRSQVSGRKLLVWFRAL